MPELKRAKIIANTKVTPHHYRMVLDLAEIAREAKPGQFLHIRCTSGLDPLLRRPLSVHRIRDAAVTLLYAVAGKGTELLSQKKQGEELDVLGPLGNSFSLDKEAKHSILVGGGMGVAPLLALAECLVKCNKGNIEIIIGAKTKDLVLCEKEFSDLGVKIDIATEDGTYGEKALATDALERLLLTLNRKLSTVVYACGPKPMLKRIAEICKSHCIPCQASWEENMGCGIGACSGCAVKTKQGYKRTCHDGPVFNLEEIEW